MSRKRVPEAEREALRRWMRFAVHASGASANQLAKAAGVAQSTVTRFLNGYADYAPSRDTIEKLAAAARVDPPKLDDLQANTLSLLTEDNECRNLISQAVRLADRAVDDAKPTYNEEASRMYREAALPTYTLLILDCLVDLKMGGTLDASAITAIETTLKRVALDIHKDFWARNPLSPFRDQSEPQSSHAPSSETSDQPSDEPAKKAATDDEPPLAA